jgi:fumarate hydratase subunit alpha
MRTIDVRQLIPIISKLVIDTNFNLPKDTSNAIKKNSKQEISPIGKTIFSMLIENSELAFQKQMPLCQDTGFAVIFLEIGQEIHFTNGFLPDAIQEAIKQGYEKGFLRKSIVSDPLFERKNTNDNIPAIIHQEFVSGDKLKITFIPKGGGAENMSRLQMLNVSDGLEGTKSFVIETVELARGNACPPLLVGIGIGGTFDLVGLLAKKALLRPIGSFHPNQNYANLETEILKLLNMTGIGPQGLGGTITALAVHIETFPCHIASLPVAVNLQCHAHRHQTIEI